MENLIEWMNRLPIGQAEYQAFTVLLAVASTLLALLAFLRSSRRKEGETEKRIEQLERRILELQEEIALISTAPLVEPRIEIAAKTTPTAEPAVEIASLSTIELMPPPLAQSPSSSAEQEVSEVVPAAIVAPLSERLLKTRVGLFGKLRQLFGGRALDVELLQEVEGVLLGSDLGIKMVDRLMSEAKAEFAKGALTSEEQFRGLLKNKIEQILSAEGADLTLKRDGLTVVMIVGVNGVGKTTTIGKLASRWSKEGHKVMVAAADTFRAAAVEQLATWAERAGVPVVKGAENAKPATVVYDGMVRAKNEGVDILIIDTAGRLHTKSNLMAELAGVVSTIKKHDSSAPHEVILVIDGATGQNAILQAREFNEATTLSGVIVTKLDGTPKGGVVVAVKDELNLPVRFIGVGEGVDDLRPFNPKEFVEALFETSELDSVSAAQPGVHAETRRRRRSGEGSDKPAQTTVL